MIKDIEINKSIILSFIQNGKMREIILLYNDESKSITHSELNFEFKNLMNDIAQIKKDVHDIHNAIQNNNVNINQNKNNNDNKNNIFDYNTKEFDIYHDFVIDNTIMVLNKQITNQENYLNELDKKVNEYQESAKNLIKKGDRTNCKKVLLEKKKYVEKMKFIEGLLACIEEEKMILDNTKTMHDILNEIKKGNRAIQEASKGLNVSDLEALKEEIMSLKTDEKEINDFFTENSEEEDNKIKKKEEEKKDEKKEEKKEVKKEEKKEEEKKEEKKEEKQSIEDNEKTFEQYKEEGNNALKEGILSIIFANEGISLEGLKRMQDQLDYIKKHKKNSINFLKNMQRIANKK